MAGKPHNFDHMLGLSSLITQRNHVESDIPARSGPQDEEEVWTQLGFRETCPMNGQFSCEAEYGFHGSEILRCFQARKIMGKKLPTSTGAFGFFHRQYEVGKGGIVWSCLVLVNLEGGFWWFLHVFFVGILSTRIILSQATAPFLTEDVFKNFLRQGLNFDVVGRCCNFAS